jgi:hydroxymethylpyrimidine kinase / phosphomethylpyrimidine kinase / thiamine-phosphate diphosphorylase
MKSLLFVVFTTASVKAMVMATPSPLLTPPVVYTIAGSDSGGGAGIQADLHAIHSFGCHGCSAITCLTAQNSCGVTEVHAPPPSFLARQLQTLLTDLPPRSIKIGMLGTKELAETVGEFLEALQGRDDKPWVVVDPVMISTSGHKLIDDEAKAAMINRVFPFADVLTPNKYEAEALLGRDLRTPTDVEQGAKEILKMGVKSVLIKGGHSLMERRTTENLAPDVNATLGYAQDFFLSSQPSPDEPRLCDGGVWIRTDRYDSEHTHGTGCTLSSAIASALALGHQQQQLRHSLSSNSFNENNKDGATSAMQPIDACCLGKAYVAAGIARAVQLGQGPGPVAHTEFPSSSHYYPRIAWNPTLRSSDIKPFRSMYTPQGVSSIGTEDQPVLGRILPIVDTVEWVEQLTRTPGITDIQLRIKNEVDPRRILERVQICQKLCAAANIRLWINDYWEAAVTAKCFGVHLGQEDLLKCKNAGGLDRLQAANLALGISTHSYGELAAALAAKPTYVSLGPIFGTTSKKVAFDPQGLHICRKWRQLVPKSMPLVAIGGINNAEIAKLVREAGADCVAVISAITQADSIETAAADLCEAMS